jgi:hypothetical protein
MNKHIFLLIIIDDKIGSLRNYIIFLNNTGLFGDFLILYIDAFLTLKWKFDFLSLFQNPENSSNPEDSVENRQKNQILITSSTVCTDVIQQLYPCHLNKHN